MSKNLKRNSSEGTILGAGVNLVGSLKDEGPIVINGQAKGDITSEDSIFVGQEAYVEGPITAKVVTVSGSVEGEIKALEVLEITETGKVSGKIEAQTLVIRPGALFIGQCKMIQPVEEKIGEVEEEPEDEIEGKLKKK
jgi:cytoskeletal protein CcmA (bactofilin family)